MARFLKKVNKLTVPEVSFYVVMLVLFCLAFWAFGGYLHSVVWAGVFAITLQPLYRFYLKFGSGKHPSLALALTWLSLLTMISLAVLLVSWSLFSSLRRVPTADLVALDWQGLMSTYLEEANSRFNIEGIINNAEFTQNIESQIRNGLSQISSSTLSLVQSVFNSTAEFVIHLLLWVMFVSTFLMQGPGLKKKLIKLSPLDDGLEELLWKRTRAMIDSIMLGSVVISVAQAMVGGALLVIFHVPSAFALTILMAIVGIIPYVGASAVLVVAVAVLALQGFFWQAGLLLFLTFLVVGNIDNVLRPRLVKKEIAMPDSFMLLAIIGGVSAYGVIGLIYGPVLMVWLRTFVEEYSSKE